MRMIMLARWFGRCMHGNASDPLNVMFALVYHLLVMLGN